MCYVFPTTSGKIYLLKNMYARMAEQDMLVPLTASLYVPGSLKDAENVLVDVGTGYYVEKVCVLM